MTESFAGRVVLVTGGTGGIGSAVVEKFVALGATTLVVARDQKKLERLRESIANTYGEESVHTYAADVCSYLNFEKLIKDVIKRFGFIDTLVTAAAGPAMMAPLLDTSLDEWRSILTIDLDSVFITNKIIARSMVEKKFGRIVNLTSFHNVATYPFRSTYNAAKAGVEGFSRALAVELGHFGITVNTVAPGPILTERTSWFLSQSPENHKGMLSRTPNCRLGEVSDIAECIAFLSSVESRHINGQRIVVDGGWSSNAWWGDHQTL